MFGFEADSVATRRCRLYLIVGNIVSFSLALAIVSHASESEKTSKGFLIDPRTTLTFTGALTIITSFNGVVGSLTSSRLVLYPYIALLTLCIIFMIYISVLCFVLESSESKLVRNFEDAANTLVDLASMHFDALRTCGTLAVVSALLLSASAACATYVSGALWVLQKLSFLTNSIILTISIFALYLSSYMNSKLSPSSNTQFGISVNTMTMVNCLFGYLCLFTHWRKHFIGHSFTTMIVAIMQLIMASLAIGAGKVFPADDCSRTITRLDTGADNLTNFTNTTTITETIIDAECMDAVVKMTSLSNAYLFLGTISVTLCFLIVVYCLKALYIIMQNMQNSDKKSKNKTVDQIYEECVEMSSRGSA